MTMIPEEETGLIRRNNATMINGSSTQQMTLSPTGVLGVREMKQGAYFELAGFLPCGTLLIQHADIVYSTERVHRPLVLGTAARLDTHTLSATLRDILCVLTSRIVPAWAGYLDDVEFLPSKDRMACTLVVSTNFENTRFVVQPLVAARVVASAQ